MIANALMWWPSLAELLVIPLGVVTVILAVLLVTLVAVWVPKAENISRQVKWEMSQLHLVSKFPLSLFTRCFLLPAVTCRVGVHVPLMLAHHPTTLPITHHGLFRHSITLVSLASCVVLSKGRGGMAPHNFVISPYLLCREKPSSSYSLLVRPQQRTPSLICFSLSSPLRSGCDCIVNFLWHWAILKSEMEILAMELRGICLCLSLLVTLWTWLLCWTYRAHFEWSILIPDKLYSHCLDKPNVESSMCPVFSFPPPLSLPLSCLWDAVGSVPSTKLDRCALSASC